MKKTEFQHILLAIFVLTVVSGFSFGLEKDWENVAIAFGFSAFIIASAIIAKKITANLLDSDIEHETWFFSRYGLKPHAYFKNPVPVGVILPILLSLISLGTFKMMALLTYETRALKYRAAKRFGFYSYTEMTDWHNGAIGAAGILIVLLISFIAYFLPIANLEYLAKLSAYYAFWNLLPISKLDGAQIFFGSRILWTVLFTIASIFAIFALITA